MGITHFSGVGIGFGAVVQFTEPALAASTTVASTYTVTGLTTNTVCLFSPHAALAAGYGISAVYCDAADELTILWANETGSTKSGSSNRGYLTAFEIPSTATVYSS